MTAIKMIYSDKILSEQKKKVSPKEALEKRLNVLSEYIESHTDKSFSEFLKEKGITKAQFISDLPVGLKNPPANDIDALTKYMGAMNFVYTNPSSLNASGCGCSLSANGQSCECPNKEGIVDGGYVTGEDSNVGADGLNAAGPPSSDLTKEQLKSYITEHEQYANENRMAGSPGNTQIELNRIYDAKKLYNKLSTPEGHFEDYDGTRHDTYNDFTDTYDEPRPDDYNPKDAFGFPLQRNGLLGASQENRLKYANAWMRWVQFHKIPAFITDAWNEAAKAAIAAQQEPPTKNFFGKLADEVKEIAKITKQNYNSIRLGLKKSPKEILEDLKREVEKSKSDLQKNITLHNANKYNPVFVVARKSFQKLLEMNIFDLAGTFNRMKMNPDQVYWDRVKKKWDNLGGTLSVLESSINAGKDKPKQLSADGELNAGGAAAAAGVGSATALAGALLGGGSAAIIPGVAPAVVAAIVSAGGVATVMIPIIASFKKSKGEPTSGPTSDVPVGEGQMPPPPEPTPDTEDMSTTMKWVIGGSIGAALLTVGAILIFGGKGK